MIRVRAALVAAAAILCSPGAAAQQTLYATSLRSEAPAGGAFVSGNLYAVDPERATATLIGAIHVGDDPVGVVSIAAQPGTGVLYGITAGLSRVVPRSLLIIDLRRAEARIVARLAARGSDLAFAADGTLYMWAPDQQRVVRVDLQTGDVSPVNRDPIPGAAGGAIVVDDARHQALVAVKGAQGTLDSVDLATGAVTVGPRLTGAVHDASIDNFTLSPEGVLYGVNSNGGAPSKAALVIVDPATGAIRNRGPLPDDVRGLIFAGEQVKTALSRESLRVGALAALALVAACIIAYAMWRH